MPELPEVETIKNALLPLIKGKRISSIDILKPKLIKSDIDVFKTKLIGKTFHDVTRHGKYLFFHLDENLVIIVHLRMEGKFQYMHRGDGILSHARIIFHFADGEALVYRDSRMFGLFYLSDEDHYQSLDFVRKVAKEPFDMNENELFQNINKHQHLAIKTVLLDQSVLAGLGNIYVDETLFRQTNPQVLEHIQKRNELHKRMSDALNANDLNAIRQIILDEKIVCPISGTCNWTEVRQFNLMFATEMGSTAEGATKIYLRPETAQGIFVNFLNVQKTGRMKIPFGIAQIGKAFRNEIVTKNFITIFMLLL